MSGDVTSRAGSSLRRGLAMLLFVVAVALWFLCDARTRGLLTMSGKLAAATALLSVPWGTFLAIVLVRTNVPGRRALMAMLLGLLVIPLYLVATAWQAGFGLDGWIAWRPTSEDLLRHWQFWSAATIHATAAVPWVTIIVAAGLASLDGACEEEALLHTGLWQVMWFVTLRRSLPSIGLATLWVAVMTFGQIAVTDLFQIRTFAEEVYVRAAGGPILEQLDAAFATTGNDERRSDSGLLGGIALAVILSAAALVVLSGLREHVRHLSLRARPLSIRQGRWAVAVLAWVCVAALLLPPVVHLSIKAGGVLRSVDGGVVREWSFARLAKVVASSPLAFRDELAATAALGVAAATAAVAAACICGWVGRRRPSVLAATWLVAAFAWGIPGPLVGAAVAWLFHQPEDSLLGPLFVLYDFNVAAWMVQVWRIFPLAAVIVVPAMTSLPAPLLDMAALDGAGPLRRLFRVAIPYRAAPLAAAWMLCGIAAAAELAATILVYAPGTTPLAVRILNLAHYGIDDRLAGITLFLYAAAVAGAATLSAWRTARKRPFDPR